MPRATRVTIEFTDSPPRVFEDVPFHKVTNERITPADPRPESGYLIVTLPFEREVMAP